MPRIVLDLSETREELGEETADRLTEKLLPRIENLKVGPYTAGEDVDYGPVITAQARERILGLIGSGVDEGADLVHDHGRQALAGLVQ